MTIQSLYISKEAEEDIHALTTKISDFKKGLIEEEQFKAYRLARGVYGQRQSGVQMYRIKLPFGKISPLQLERIAEAAKVFTNGNLHLTTRQDIQLHYVKVADAPEIWRMIEEVGVTSREACGNTVRNITASSKAGIDKEEPFDVSPYAQAMFEYFLRNPICQDMGRKIKISFSSSERDSGFTFFHDIGFIPKLKTMKDTETRGFEVRLGGGLGGQPFVAQTAYDFLEADKIIPFTEACLRVFDRYGEREKRFKARLKFLIDERKGLGLNKFMDIVKQEQQSLACASFPIHIKTGEAVHISDKTFEIDTDTIDRKAFSIWRKTNVEEQKQEGYFSVTIKVSNGNLSSFQAKKIKELVFAAAADDMRITVNQNIMLKYVREANLEYVYKKLTEIGLADSGAEKLFDIVACPGTDTCNLGVSDSTNVALAIEKMLKETYLDLVHEEGLNIKISGCMNACGQHTIANIGFHGSSIKNKDKVIPALQVLLGGGFDREGKGVFAEKIIKIPSKRVLHAIRLILDDYLQYRDEYQFFNTYYQSKGKMYFYTLLKHLTDLTTLKNNDYIDWGHEEEYKQAIGVGECAGVSLDLVGTIFASAKEKLGLSVYSMKQNHWADAVYHAYSAFVIGAKALLLSEDIQCNTHIGIIQKFDQHFVAERKINFPHEERFEDKVLEMKIHKPTSGFVEKYKRGAQQFIQSAETYLHRGKSQKQVINSHYKA